MNNDPVIAGWAEDFVLALLDRPFLAKILLRFVFGKYAYREFVGMVECLDEKFDGHIILNGTIGYSLESMDYHKERVSLVWWEPEL